jgi:hypothetical protein
MLKNLFEKLNQLALDKITVTSQVAAAHAYNHRYLGGWDWEDHSSRPAWANSL